MIPFFIVIVSPAAGWASQQQETIAGPQTQRIEGSIHLIPSLPPMAGHG
jgi:hypothetical protein